MTVVRKPRSRASETSGIETWPAPTTTRCARGACTSKKAPEPSPAIGWVRDVPSGRSARASSRAAASSDGSPSEPAAAPSCVTSSVRAGSCNRRTRQEARPRSRSAAMRRYRSTTGEAAGDSSSRSTRTSTVPAQERPISQASSSPKARLRRRDSPPPSTPSDSARTRASTQPPMVTEPSTRPPSPTHILAPSFFGVAPRVATSVAIATRRSILASASRSRCSSSIDGILEPSAVQGERASGEEMPLEVAEALQVVRRGEDGHVGERRLHAPGERLVARAAQERIEPDEPAAAGLDRLQRRSELCGVASVPAVAEHHDDGAPVDKPRPLRVERGEAGADARSAGPVVHPLREVAQGADEGPLAQRFGDAQERSGKGEALHARYRSLQRVEELQQQAAIEVHRPGDVAEGHDPRPPWLAPAEPQLDRLGSGGERTPHGPPQIDPRTALRGGPAAPWARGELARQPFGDPADLV